VLGDPAFEDVDDLELADVVGLFVDGEWLALFEFEDLVCRGIVESI
jgi:hypothetical protein